MNDEGVGTSVVALMGVMVVMLLLGVVLTCMGCATIMPPAAAPVLLQSEPAGATVSINGEVKGRTPLTVPLACQPVPMIGLTLDGFTSVEVPMPKQQAWDGRLGMTWPAEKCQGTLTVVLRPTKEGR